MTFEEYLDWISQNYDLFPPEKRHPIELSASVDLKI